MLRILKSKVSLVMLTVICSIGLSNCTVHHHHVHKHKRGHLPPGQAKKISGDKSARRHAPGHNK